uniref:O-methyltransferase 3 n=1 Tax=Solanum tuberosum TaxID=4113 RepID=M1DBX9_SOLTU
MASDSRLVVSVVIENCKAVFEGLKSLVDVGGGIGIVAKVIADAFLEMNCIIFYLPHKKCKEEIPSKEKGGKVIIIEMVLMDRNLEKEDDKSYETQLFFDMLMMVHVSGKERNQQDLTKLFSSADFSDYNIIPMLGLRSIIEVFP